jgi:ribosomal protein L15E
MQVQKCKCRKSHRVVRVGVSVQFQQARAVGVTVLQGYLTWRRAILHSDAGRKMPPQMQKIDQNCWR